MEKFNVDEMEWAMGFRICTTTMQGIFEGAHRRILGQVMDMNYLTWIFNLVLAKQLHFSQSHPPIPPHLSTIMAMQGGVML
jgi:hypothetical protein